MFSASVRNMLSDSNHVCFADEEEQMKREDPIQRRSTEELEGAEAEAVQSTCVVPSGFHQTDTSTHRCKQVVNGIERPIAYTNRKMNPADYPTQRQALLAIVHAFAAFRIYFLDKPPIVETDRKSLEGRFTQKMANRRLARRYGILAEYQPSFSYLPVAKNRIADALSRRPDLQLETKFFHEQFGDQ
ncbi:Retrotransposon nucleocapsid protein [Phytophthora megakarya]|uniref:Retrotransposon nucleocapsid protein n=1 Tax=Phytophthora megakarya TaxID=4795 RepID=A0A225W3K6_9STRA|nr:Retrotransposon nucleocapsid protein [Phytophthora megakarya]